MIDHKRKGQRVLEMVYLLIAIKADFALVYFWVCLFAGFKVVLIQDEVLFHWIFLILSLKASASRIYYL